MPPFSATFKAPSLVPGAVDSLLKAILLRRQLDEDAQRGELRDVQLAEAKRRAEDEAAFQPTVQQLASTFGRPAGPSLAASMPAPNVAPPALDPMGEGALAPPPVPPSMPGDPSLAAPTAGPGGFTLAQALQQVPGAAALMGTEKGRFALKQAGMKTEDEFQAGERYRDAVTQGRASLKAAKEAWDNDDPLTALRHQAAFYSNQIGVQRPDGRGPAWPNAEQHYQEILKQLKATRDEKKEEGAWKTDGPRARAARNTFNREIRGDDPMGAIERFRESMAVEKMDSKRFRLIAETDVAGIDKSLDEDVKNRLLSANVAAFGKLYNAELGRQIDANEPRDTTKAWTAAWQGSPPQVQQEMWNNAFKGDKVPTSFKEFLFGRDAKTVDDTLAKQMNTLVSTSVDPTTGQPYVPGTNAFARRVIAETLAFKKQESEGKRKDDASVAERAEVAGMRRDRDYKRLVLENMKRDLREMEKEEGKVSITELADQRAKVTAAESEATALDAQLALRTGRTPPSAAPKPRGSEKAGQRRKELERQYDRSKAPENLRDTALEKWPAAAKAARERSITDTLRKEGYQVESDPKERLREVAADVLKSLFPSRDPKSLTAQERQRVTTEVNRRLSTP